MSNMRRTRSGTILNRAIRFKKVDDSSVFDAIEKFRSGLKLGYRTRLSDEEICARLRELTDENGVLNLYSDIRLYKIINSRAFFRKITIPDVIASVGFTEYKSLSSGSGNRGKKISVAVHRERLKECIDGMQISEVSKKQPQTYGFLLRAARKGGCTIEDAANDLLGVARGTYKYVKYTSVYSMDSGHYFADDKDVFNAIREVLLSCMDENGYISYLDERAPKFNAMMVTAAKTNGLTMKEYISIFAPEAIYETKDVLNAPESDSIARENLERYADEEGNVDSVRENSALYRYIMRLADSKGMELCDYVRSLGYNIKKQYYPVDYEEYFRINLDKYFGKDKKIKSFSECPGLYSRAEYYCRMFPGGAMDNLEDFFAYFGYEYSGHKVRSISYVEVKNAFYEAYGAPIAPDGSRRNVNDLWQRPDVWRLAINYCGKKAITLKELVDDLGYTGYNGTGAQNLITKMYLSPQEYAEYKQELEARKTDGNKNK